MKVKNLLNRFCLVLATTLGGNNTAISQSLDLQPSMFFDLQFSILQEIQISPDGFETASSGSLILREFVETTDSFIFRFQGPLTLTENSEFIERSNIGSPNGYIHLQQGMRPRLVLNKKPISTPKERYYKQYFEGFFEVSNPSQKLNPSKTVRMGMRCFLDKRPGVPLLCHDTGYEHKATGRYWGTLTISTTHNY